MKFSTITKTTVLGLAAITLSALSVGTLNAQAATVATVTSPVSARLYTREAKLITNRALAPNTPWRVGDIISVYGEKYYQVATNEFLKATDSQLSGDAVAKYPTAPLQQPAQGIFRGRGQREQRTVVRQCAAAGRQQLRRGAGRLHRRRAGALRAVEDGGRPGGFR